MKTYSDFMPKVEYNGVLISDITHRFQLNDKLKEYADFYYKQRIELFQTPEQVSHSLYGTTDHWWIICVINDVVDPFYDWVMQEEEVFAYAEKLFDDVNAIRHYVDTEGVQYPENNLEQTYEPVTELEHLINLNDEKLRINTIRPEHIRQITKEFSDILKITPNQKQE